MPQFHHPAIPIYTFPESMTYHEYTLWYQGYQAGLSGVPIDKIIRPGDPYRTRLLTRGMLPEKVASQGVFQGNAVYTEMWLNKMIPPRKVRK